MQLLGIGFANKSWNLLTKQLQNQLIHQFDSDLIDDSFLFSKIESKGIKKVLIDVINYKPDWIMLNHNKTFNNFKMSIKFLELLRNESEKKLHFALFLENLRQNINSILKFNPEFELVNEMNFRVSSPELILEKNFRSFPRIRLNKEFIKIKYRTTFGDLIIQSVHEIPSNLVIPFNEIEMFETISGELEPQKWLKNILDRGNKEIENHHILGIIFEKRGCYLFPGIPFNSILNLKIDNLKIDHLILLGEYGKGNPPYKRLIKSMALEFQSWMDDRKYLPKKKYLPTYCFLKEPFSKELLENLFYRISGLNVKIITEINLLKNILKDNVNLINLDGSLRDTFFKKKYIDWSEDYLKIFSVLNSFVDFNELRPVKKASYLPIHKTEFENCKNTLSKEENEIQTLLQQAENYSKIFAQELEFCKKLDSLSNLLIEVMSSSRSWEDVLRKSPDINQSKMILFCGDESRAAELNIKLKGVDKKLWINPLKFKQPDDLIQLNTKMIKSYLKHKGIVIDSECKIFLENLCMKTKNEIKRANEEFEENNLKIKHLKTDLSLIHKNKKNLALRWINLNFQQLLFRDKHLFKSISRKEL